MRIQSSGILDANRLSRKSELETRRRPPDEPGLATERAASDRILRPFDVQRPIVHERIRDLETFGAQFTRSLPERDLDAAFGALLGDGFPLANDRPRAEHLAADRATGTVMVLPEIRLRMLWAVHPTDAFARSRSMNSRNSAMGQALLQYQL